MTRRGAAVLSAALLLLHGCSGHDILGPYDGIRFVAITAGSAHTCALSADGLAWCWGSNARGQLGLGWSGGTERGPAAVTGQHHFRVISAGHLHTCAIDVEGVAWCWGANDSGQLGDGSYHDAEAPSPVASAGRFGAIAAGLAHSCAVDLIGVVACWGSNARGQVGPGAGSSTAVPVAVRGAPPAHQVAAGGQHSCAVGTAGTFCWGGNGSFQLGGGTRKDSPSPIRVGTGAPAVLVSSGLGHLCALGLERAVSCWGDNRVLQVGAPIGDAAGVPVNPRLPDLGFRTVAAGGDHACAATLNAVWCWGSEKSPTLGELATLPHAMPAVTGPIDALAVGGAHACAILGGAIMCWGDDSSGQLGRG